MISAQGQLLVSNESQIQVLQPDVAEDLHIINCSMHPVKETHGQSFPYKY